MRASDVMEQVQEALEMELEDVAVTPTARGLVLRYEDSGETFLLPNATLVRGSAIDDEDEEDDDSGNDFDDEDEEG